MKRRRSSGRGPSTGVTILPNAGLRGLYALVRALCTEERPAPIARGQGLLLCWEQANGHQGGVLVVTDPAPPEVFEVVGRILPGGELEKEETCTATEVLALRNLAADPDRRFRRFGFDEQACPFCGSHLPYETLDFGLGHCQPCGKLLGWPLDQTTVDRAEDELRADIMRELEDGQPSDG